MPDAEGVQVTSYGARNELARGTARLACWPCRRPAGCRYGRGSVYRALLQLGGGAGRGRARSAGRDRTARAGSHRPPRRAEARGGAVARDRHDRPRGEPISPDCPAVRVTFRIVLAHSPVHAGRAASGHPVAFPFAVPVAIAIAIAVPFANRLAVPVAHPYPLPHPASLALPGRLAVPLAAVAVSRLRRDRGARPADQADRCRAPAGSSPQQ